MMISPCAHPPWSAGAWPSGNSAAYPPDGHFSFQASQQPCRDNIQSHKSGGVRLPRSPDGGSALLPAGLAAEPLPFSQADDIAHGSFLIGSTSRKREHEGSAFACLQKCLTRR